MARRGKKRIAPPDRGEPRGESQRRETGQADVQWAVWLVALVFLVGFSIYLALFYRTELAPDVYGYQRLAYLLLPDQLCSSWCGGEVGRVAILDRAWPLAVAGAIWGVAGMLGWLVLDALRVRKYLDRLETAVLALGIGLNGVSLFALAVGLLGGLRQPIWFGSLALGLGTAVVWRQLQSRRLCDTEEVPSAGRAPGEHVGGGTRGKLSWWWGLLPFAGVLLAGGVLPPQHFDVLEYHLQVPKEWYQQGSVTFLPHNVYGNMPLGGEMLAAQAMSLMPGPLSWWWGALAGKVAMAGYPVLTALLLFAAGRRFYSIRAGVFAALIYISTAWIAFVSLHGLNEGVVAYYLFAAFYAGKIWWDAEHAQQRPQWGLLALTGLPAGAAVACKYTALLFVVAPLAALAFGIGRGYRVRAAVGFLLVVFLACGLWFAKNWAFTGNPTYPLVATVFGGETRTPEKVAQWRRAHQVPPNEQGDRYSFSQAGKAVLTVLGGSWRQNPLIVPCAVLLIFRGRRNRDLAYWAAMLALFLVAWWVTTHRLTRFWVPAIPLMALLAGVGATWSPTSVWRRFMAVVLAVMLVVNFVFITAPGLADNRYFVSLEQLRDDLRLVQGDQQRAIAFRYLCNHVPAGAQVLMVGEAAVFSLRVPALYNTCFDECVFERIFRGRDEAERRARLSELGVSHVYIDWAELRRYRQPGNYGYSSYVTRSLVHGELVQKQQLLRRVSVPDLDPRIGEIFAVGVR